MFCNHNLHEHQLNDKNDTDVGFFVNLKPNATIGIIYSLRLNILQNSILNYCTNEFRV